MVKAMYRFLLALLFCPALLALPVSNPANPALYNNGLICSDPCNLFSWREAIGVRFGFYGDYVYERHMEVEEGQRRFGDVNHVGLFTNAGTVVFNTCRNLEAYGIIGVTNAEIFMDGGLYSNDTTMIQLEISPTLSWGVGARGILWDYRHFRLGAEAQFQFMKPNFENMIRYASGDVTYLSRARRTMYREWQAGLGAAYEARVGGVAFIPYMAAKVAGGKFSFRDFQFTFQDTDIVYTLRTLVPKKIWGYAVGMTCLLCERIGITAEGRFADENALYVDGQFRF